MSIGAKTGIGWTDETWNAISGCEECDPGCKHCYAKNVAQRLAGMPNEKIKAKYLPVVSGGEWTGKITITEKEIIAPLRSTKKAMVFANSMSDLFYSEVPDAWIDRHLVVMYLAKHKFFQVLTKRHARLKNYFENLTQYRIVQAFEWLCDTFKLNGQTAGRNLNFLPEEIAAATNIIWMVSASNQRGVELRVPDLLATPFIKKRGISLEPLISEVNLTAINKTVGQIIRHVHGFDCLHGADWTYNEILKRKDFYNKSAKLDWVIVGGESAKLTSEVLRPLHPQFAQRVVSDCLTARVPVFFKQWGDWKPVDAWREPGAAKYKGEWILVQGNGMVHYEQNYEQAKSVAVGAQAFMRVGKERAGNQIDGSIFEQFPEIKFGDCINYFQK